MKHGATMSDYGLNGREEHSPGQAPSRRARIPIQYDFMLECDDEYPQWASDTFWVEMEDGCTWQELWEGAKALARAHYREHHRGNWYGYVSFVAGIPLGDICIEGNETVSWEDPEVTTEFDD